MKTEAEPASET